jgi:hypothetical protein
MKQSPVLLSPTGVDEFFSSLPSPNPNPKPAPESENKIKQKEESFFKNK